MSQISTNRIIPHTIRAVKPTAGKSSTRHAAFEPFLLGTALSAISSVGYSCANVCLRWLAPAEPLLVSCIKAVPTMLIATLLVVLGLAQGRTRWPAPRTFVAIAAVGTLAQLGGNGFFQWSLGQVGLALTVPLCSGTMIIAAAVLGRFWLGEGVTPRSALSLAILILAITVLSFGAERSPQQAELATATAPITVALFAACFSGVAYATLNVFIRRLVTGTVQLPVVLATVSSMGVISLGSASILRSGWASIAQTPLDDLLLMFVAGSFNAVGFFALTKALQYVSIVHFNAVSASQAALAALAGVTIFGETLTASLAAGITLTIGGLCLVDRARAKHAAPQSANVAGQSPVVEEEFVAVPPVQVPDAAALPREPTTR